VSYAAKKAGKVWCGNAAVVSLTKCYGRQVTCCMYAPQLLTAMLFKTLYVWFSCSAREVVVRRMPATPFMSRPVPPTAPAQWKVSRFPRNMSSVSRVVASR